MSTLPGPAPVEDQFLTVRLERFIYGGEALGRLPDGRAVFVPFGLPGELVRARPLEEKSGHVRAELVEVLEPSPDRITPRCHHFGACGGCHYQHLPYPDQLGVKAGILRDQLRRIGKLEDPPVTAITASPLPWNYRNYIQFHFTEAGRLGFVDASGRGVLPIGECHLPEEALSDLWPTLDLDPQLDLERLSLRLGLDGQIMLMLESEQTPILELEADLSVVHLAGQEAVVMAGEGSLVMAVNARPFRVSAGSFFQVNTGAAGKMVEYLLEQLPVTTTTTLLDVYCGVGLFSAFYAPRVGRLVGIEASPSACADFVLNLDEFDNVDLYEAPAELVLPSLDFSPQAVILDPPRAGLERRALEALLALGPERIAYVSCDPSTLARDAARLITGGYRLRSVAPFDLFPQTYHIESISLFTHA
jgi:23S rRNA (uracil1939-C5)-methyltransferase